MASSSSSGFGYGPIRAPGCLCSCAVDDVSDVDDNDYVPDDDSEFDGEVSSDSSHSGGEDGPLAIGDTPDGIRNYHRETAANYRAAITRRASENEVGSAYRPYIADLVDEEQELEKTLSFWELHDLEAIGHTVERIRERFYEMGHRIAPRPRRVRPYQQPLVRESMTCSRCNSPAVRELIQAIVEGWVDVCNRCNSPRLAPFPADFVRWGSRFDGQCVCRCTCYDPPIDPTIDDAHIQPPVLRFISNPALPRCRHYAAQWVHYALYVLGYNIIDRAADRARRPGQYLHLLPTLDQVVDNGYDWQTVRDLHFQDMDDREEYHLARFFPNGEMRDYNTDTSLPLEIELAFRRIDPNAFNHETIESQRRFRRWVRDNNFYLDGPIRFQAVPSLSARTTEAERQEERDVRREARQRNLGGFHHRPRASSSMSSSIDLHREPSPFLPVINFAADPEARRAEYLRMLERLEAVEHPHADVDMAERSMDLD